MYKQLPEHSSQGWYHDALQLLEALERPDSYGFKTRGEMLLAIAAARGIATRGLQRMLDAAIFLKSTYPDLVEKPVFGGFSVVNFLEKLHRLDPDWGYQLAPDVIRGQLSTSIVKRAYEEALARTRDLAPAAAVRSIAKTRSIAFGRLCLELVATDPARFCGSKAAGATVVKNFADVAIQVDAAIFVNGKQHTAVESKVFGVSPSPKELVSVLGHVGLLLRRFKQVWLLVPQSADAQAAELMRLAKIYELEGFMIGVVDEATGNLQLAG